nr:ubiquitin-conjugating enzyme E2 Z-like [Rhipicephalus microplus]
MNPGQPQDDVGSSGVTNKPKKEKLEEVTDQAGQIASKEQPRYEHEIVKSEVEDQSEPPNEGVNNSNEQDDATKKSPAVANAAAAGKGGTRPPTGNRKTSPNKLPPLLRTSGTRSPASTKNRPPDACSGSNRTSRRSSAIAYPGIFISAEEHNVTNIHALILGPPGTPYEGGFFHFLIKCPADYPHSPPRVRLMTTDAGRVRFGPSFYENGKVCLGLLGTSSYGTTWSSSQCLGNVLYTIKSLMTNEDPVTLGSGLRSPPGARNVAERQDTLQHHPAARDHQGRCVQRGRGMSAKKFFGEYMTVVRNHLHLTGSYMNDSTEGGVPTYQFETLMAHLVALREDVELVNPIPYEKEQG